ncbi:hypothetical protein CPB85DRAFT_1551449 [Mucidula mucida]|nr:hypothetical protein CPB85DRAFT_1551449 [Mucidula mucida]
MIFVAPLLLLASTASAALLTLQSPRITITGSDGSQLRSDPLSLKQQLAQPVTLSQTDILKITFQTVDADSGKGIQPQQTFLRFYDEHSGEEGIQPLRVTNGGKVKFELNMAKPPLSFPATSDAPLKVSLILGAVGYTPLNVNLFDLFVPASQAILISAMAAGLVWPLGLFFLGSYWGHVSPKMPRLLSAKILPFTATLGAFEVLMVWYWVDLKLGDVLLYGGLLGVVTIFTGQYALSSISERRLGVQK